jgi:catechol 2,3-dioxygenase-like lactoylglutathione lyase family enzyme
VGGPYEVGVRSWGVDARVGDTIAGKLPLGDGALYHLALTAGEMVEVEVASEQFDAKFDLLDPDGNQVACGIDDRSPVDRTAFHRFLVAKPGTWHVLVHCCSGQASGAFTLRTASQPLPQLEVGKMLPVRPGSHVHLDLTNGDVVWLSLRSATFDAALQVIDPAGDAGFVAEGGGLGGDVLVAYRASHTGRHTLIVHARTGGGDGELKVVLP